MSSESLSTSAPEIESYLHTWTKSVCSVLEQVAGVSFTVEVLPAEQVGAQLQALAEIGVWIRLATSKRLRGEQTFLLPGDDARRFAQILMAEPLDDTVAFTDDHHDAVAELFRQFAGTAAISLKAMLGGEVDLQFAGSDRPTWVPAAQEGFRFSSQQTPPILMYVQISAELAAALRPTVTPVAAAEMPCPPRKQLAAVEGSPRETNIDLLLDVELEVALRFGERQMLLRDILELSAGAVVELDRQIQEPADLLVTGKMIARGEVVVVDGNYGLRVTEIISPRQRIEPLGR